MDALKLAEAAIAWNRIRVFAERLREARSLYLCEKSKEGHVGAFIDENFNELPVYRAKSDTPCWKGWHENHYGDGFVRDPEPTWCQSCRTRTLIHQAYREATARRGARMRVLQRYAALAAKEAARC